MRQRIAVALCIGLFGYTSAGNAVDGVIEINQSNVSGVVNALHVIGAPGSYRLTSDLVAPADFIGIRVDVDDVTIDLNGFTLSGSGTAFSDGISIGNGNNVEVRNGTIRGFPRHGVFGVGDGLRVIDVRATANSSSGIRAETGEGALVRGCTADENGGVGIRVLSDGSLVIGNVARGNTGVGLQLGAEVGYAENVLFGNNNGGAQTSGSGKLIGCNLSTTTVSCPP